MEHPFQAIAALKKGAPLLKYGRKGNPNFCSFRLSNDETSLIWLTGDKEKLLNLSSISNIILGQKTSVFQRLLQPKKDHLSFSLIYNNGKRSLDLICKDKVEADLWILGLRALVASAQTGRSKIDGWNHEGISLDDTRGITSNRPSDNSANTTLEVSSSENLLFTKDSEKPNATNMHVKGASSDVLRVSVSSAPSTSSHGSAQDDTENLGDVYVWGEVICDNSIKADAERYSIPAGRMDILLPRPLESNIVFDVQFVACGLKHAALITRQGEVFTWGEESGGCLGHGVVTDIVQPRLVVSLACGYTDYVACGEFHTCAVTGNGDLYTWGDGIHNAGLLGHGTNVSHWVPKRVSGPLEGLHVSYVACGTWHTALITTNGQLFTFGDGTFGVLGHGNREHASYPREVESLMGLKTIAVACGVWHTAAIVEVIVTRSSSGASSGKLFTWGDGDKYRLGHGDKESRFKPTCVPSLIDYNFYKLACGHCLTVGLTTAHRVFTMGSAVYGQLGNPVSNGKLPCLVEEKLANESVEEVACGSYHVAVLTTKNEVYTWGKGANGRLGHGDVEDHKVPTLVEALKDRHVKRIACGSNFSAAICRHKWVSGADQSQCSSCRQAFGFTRKRHNCYNCGLVHCHSCTSRKAFRAALAPNPAKPYRVCDSCFLKLSKAQEHGGVNTKRASIPRLSAESKDKLDQLKVEKSSIGIGYSNMDLIKQLDSKAAKQGKKAEPLSSLTLGTQVPLSLKDMTFRVPADLNRPNRKTGHTSKAHSVSNSRAVSPFSRKSSPPRAATPIPSTGFSLPKNVDGSLKIVNELLNQEVQNLRDQVESYRQRCEFQEVELGKSAKKMQDALSLAAEESARSKAAKEVIKSLTAQLKDMAERLPNGVYDSDDMRPVYLPNGGYEAEPFDNSNLDGETSLQSEASSGPHPFLRTKHNSITNGVPDQVKAPRTSSSPFQSQRVNDSSGEDIVDLGHTDSNGGTSRGRAENTNGRENTNGGTNESSDNSSSRNTSFNSNQVEEEWIEQYEPGVYITLVAFMDGTRDLKHVRFSRRRFGEHQAETWWSMNREKVYEKYHVRASDKTSSTASQSVRRSEEEFLPYPQAR